MLEVTIRWEEGYIGRVFTELTGLIGADFGCTEYASNRLDWWLDCFRHSLGSLARMPKDLLAPRGRTRVMNAEG